MKPTPWGCALAASLLVVNGWTVPAMAQEPQPKLQIVIAEGEGAINNIKDRTVREPVVQVEDENHKPIAGAAVVFFLPNSGSSATFFDGTRTLAVSTDAQGRATARGIKLNSVAGQMQIRVTASYQGQTATATITQTNISGAAKGLSTTAKILIIAAIAAGAAAGAIAATTGRGPATTAAPPPITITPGTPTVGAP